MAGSPGLGRAGSPAHALSQELLSLAEMEAESPRQGSAVSLPSLSRAAAAEWELWPARNEGCAFERGDFQVVNDREWLQLLSTSQCCALSHSKAEVPFWKERRTSRWTPALPGLQTHPPHCQAAARGAAGARLPANTAWGSAGIPAPVPTRGRVTPSSWAEGSRPARS